MYGIETVSLPLVTGGPRLQVMAQHRPRNPIPIFLRPDTNKITFSLTEILSSFYAGTIACTALSMHTQLGRTPYSVPSRSNLGASWEPGVSYIARFTHAVFFNMCTNLR